MSPLIDICPLADLPPGSRRTFEHEDFDIAVLNVGGTLYAIEDRCSHDDGPLGDGPVDAAACTIECPRHGSLFDLQTGKPTTLPAYQPVETFPVTVADGMVRVDVD
ncbi:3-phenylpropionate/cinnamic acid dioxygenase ferredoxin subunit [Paraconexibacter sp. AEG42_29]|uniref:3-phenylpropionate/cinnamic acid dioxygenase ferredoxin subunit n=1 Tax=Paraconexibacter sp. AEG42_29 TaxID=2997339 RepID=A0AAU7AZZ4_9ACTN